METLASLSSQIDGRTCAATPEGASEAATQDVPMIDPECDCEETYDSPLSEITALAEEVSEDSYFAGLAEIRKSDFECARDFVQGLAGNEQELSSLIEDVEEKLISYSELNADIVNLMGQISNMSNSLRYARDNETRASIESDLAELRPQLEMMQIAAAAIRGSVPLIHLGPIDDLFQRTSVRLNGPSVQIRNQDRPAAETMAELDRDQFRSQFRQALSQTLSGLRSDISTLESGITSGGASFDRSMRESLAQDRGLLEAYVGQNPNLSDEMNQIACDVDDRYGTGAESRDAILNFGSIGLTLASFGIGGLIRGTAAVGANVFNGARVAALSGMMSVRSANIISAVAIGLDSAAGINEIGRACFGSSLQTNVTIEAGQCNEPTIEQREQDNCVLASGLTALGIGLASPAGQELLGRALVGSGIVRGPSGVDAGLPPGITSRVQTYDDPNQLPGGAGGVSSAGLNEGRYIRTQDIRPEDLPYDQGLRAPRQPTEFGSIEDVPTVEVTPTNIILTSDEHSGSNGVVRLATLPDGRPVAIKAVSLYTPPGINATDTDVRTAEVIFAEAQGHEYADALGVGPEFHGIFVDEYGRTNVVMDLVTGDFPGESAGRVTAATLSEFDEMVRRIDDGGYLTGSSDFQFYVTNDGHPRVIDAGVLASPNRQAGGDPAFLRSMASNRLSLTRSAPTDVGIAYFEGLRTSDPTQYAMTMRLMGQWLGDHRRHLVEPYADYFEMASNRARDGNGI